MQSLRFFQLWFGSLPQAGWLASKLCAAKQRFTWQRYGAQLTHSLCLVTAQADRAIHEIGSTCCTCYRLPRSLLHCHSEVLRGVQVRLVM